MKTIEITELPEKISLAELDAKIKDEYPSARVTYRETHNTINKEGIRKSTPAAIVIEAPDDADGEKINKLVDEHKPDKSDAEKEREASAAKLFEILSYDSRMRKLLDLVGKG